MANWRKQAITLTENWLTHSRLVQWRYYINHLETAELAGQIEDATEVTWTRESA
jgi:hypothetical protein